MPQAAFVNAATVSVIILTFTETNDGADSKQAKVAVLVAYSIGSCYLRLIALSAELSIALQVQRVL